MRSKPVFSPASSSSQNLEHDSTSCSSCILMFFAAVAFYFVPGAIDRVFSGSGNRLDHMICYGVLIGLVILVILVNLQNFQDDKKARKAQGEWKIASKSVEVAIVNRTYHPGGTWEDGDGMPHSSYPSYRLALELTDEQRLLYLNLKSVSVTVDEKIYSKIKDRDVVRVYYQPASPMTFFLKKKWNKYGEIDFSK